MFSRNVIENVENLYELGKMNIDQLAKLLGGKQNAMKLYYFLRSSIMDIT